MKPIKIIVEKHPDGYVAYPIGLKGVVVREGDTYDNACCKELVSLCMGVVVGEGAEAVG